MAGFFVTGSDTGVGKTFVTAAMLSVFRAAGVDAVPMKPVQTGADQGLHGGLRSQDLDFCLDAAGLSPGEEAYALMNPFAFAPACSPHLAAAQAGAAIELSRIRNAYDALASRHELVLVEGAGGVMAPLDNDLTMLDLMVELGLPVLLVTRSGLGTINHSLMSLSILAEAGLKVAGVIFNDAAPADFGIIERDNESTITRLGRVQVAGRIPFLPELARIKNDASAFYNAVAGFMGQAKELLKFEPPLRSAETWSEDCAALWHPYTKRSAIDSGAFPMIVRGRGVYLEDAAGMRYLDGISSWWSCAPGHSHPRLLKAMRCQAGLLQHSILGNLSHPQAVRLASRLSRLVGGGRHVLFASDGACAVEAAIKVAFQYWRNRGVSGRNQLLSHFDAYHGDTLGAMAAGFLTAFHAPFEGIVTQALRVQPPDCQPCPWGQSPDNCAMECFEPMQAALDENAASLAAVIVEPLCRGSAGMRMYAPAYLRRLAEACMACEVLLIVDEVAMGFGRTGRMFAYEHAGIEPDIICVGKALSGGTLPISATLVKDEIYHTFNDAGRDTTFYHGHTFAGNPIAAAVALEALSVYEEEKLPERAAALGRLLLERLASLSDLPHVRSVRGLGLIGVVELGPDPEAGSAYAQKARNLLMAKGILLRPLGPVLYFMPPLIIAEQTLLDAADAIVQVVKDL